MIVERFFPDEYCESSYEIDYKKLYEEGIRGLIFDIDNTLVPHDAPADPGSVRLFNELHDIGFKCMLLSNNREKRVKSFADKVKYTDYIHKAGKPSTSGYKRAMERMGTDRSSTVFIGDQLFTDVWGARRTGIRSILVNKINSREEIQIILKRIPEKLVLWFYFKDHGKEGKKHD